MQPARRLYDWASKKAFSPFAPLWLGLIFLSELFLFLPMDALLMLFCLQNPKRRFIYATVATLASALMGIIGYEIGYFLWDAIGPFLLAHFLSPTFFQRLIEHYQSHATIAIFIGGFLPIPLKAVTLSAGFCQLALPHYLTILLLARGLRFFLLAEVMQRWGIQIKAFVDRHFNRLVMAVGAKIALTVSFFWILGH